MALLQKGYLGSTPLWRNVDWFEDGAPVIIGTSGAVTVTANTSAHTKGSWSQLIASTAANASFLVVRVYGVASSAFDTSTLLDIAIGASGSETAVAENIAVGGANSSSASLGCFFGFPVKIPSGSRLSARIQSVVTGGKTASVEVFAVDAGDYNTAPTAVDVIGGNTANSQGISFSGSSGTWVQATASTSQNYRGISAVFSAHDASISSIAVTADIGVGASASETAFGTSRLQYNNTEAVAVIEPCFYLFGRNIPAGSRLAVKHNIASNPSRYGFTLIGIP